MKYGVIDIGTNTIRSVVYNGELKVLAEMVAESTILKYTENGCLTEKGIGELCSALKNAAEFFKNNSADAVNAFATSAMRDVKNFLSVKDAVFASCKIEIELLSEYEEAMCDFTSVKLQTSDKVSGAAADIGGGSCQLMLCKNGELLYHCSEKLGVKRMYNRFGELTHENESEVRSFIKESFSCVPFFSSDTLFVMGGTSKKIKKLTKKLLDSADLTPNTLNKCLELYYEKNQGYMELSSTEINKIPYGITIVDELCRFCGADKISVLSGGVREGYVLRHIPVNQDKLP